MRLRPAAGRRRSARGHRLRLHRRRVGGCAARPAARRLQLAYRLEINEYRGAERVQLNCQHFKLRSVGVLGFVPMELNQIKRFIKDLEERTDSLRRYL